MEKNYVSEEEVKKALNISDFRSLSKDKVMEFVSLIPKVDKDVAISIVNQFPNYTDMAKSIVGGMINLCSEALQNTKEGNKEVIQAYKVVLETLKERLQNEKLTLKERNRITDEMLEIAEKIDTVNDKHNTFIKDILTTVGGVAVGVVVLGAAVLGGFNIKGKA